MAEKEYIERGALIEAIRREHKPIVQTGSLADVFCASIETTIVNQPAADVVEVVRCKDCFYNANASCLFAEDNDPEYKPDYYCACGLRKEQT